MRNSIPWRITVLVAAFESNVTALKGSADPSAEATQLVEVLENGYGIANAKAAWAVESWCKVLGIPWNRLANGKPATADIIVTDPLSGSAIMAAQRICQHCQTVNDSDSSFCRKCGKSLVVVCPECGAKLDLQDTFCSKCGNRLESKATTKATGDTSTSNTAYADRQEGEMFRFGNFSLLADGTTGPVEWLVLSRQNDRMLVISRYGIHCRQYHFANRAITWESCDLRRWLNGEFLSKAFNDSERSCIINTRIDNWDNEKYGTPGGETTEDSVFILSLDEANTLFKDDNARRCRPSRYAVSKGAYTENGNCWWWLRSPGVDPSYAASVGSSGNLNRDGNFVSDCDDCVRPAMYLKI